MGPFNGKAFIFRHIILQKFKSNVIFSFYLNILPVPTSSYQDIFHAFTISNFVNSSWRAFWLVFKHRNHNFSPIGIKWYKISNILKTKIQIRFKEALNKIPSMITKYSQLYPLSLTRYESNASAVVSKYTNQRKAKFVRVSAVALSTKCCRE